MGDSSALADAEGILWRGAVSRGRVFGSWASLGEKAMDGLEQNHGPERLVGVWVDAETARVHTAWRPAGGGPAECRREPFRGFAWVADSLCEEPPWGSLPRKALAGEGALRHRLEADDPAGLSTLAELPRDPQRVEMLRPWEHQYLLTTGHRLIAPGFLGGLVRLQVDIETDCEEEGGFSDPSRKGDRVLAIGLRWGEGPQEEEILELEEPTDAAERALLKTFGERLRTLDPDLVEGHNFFNFDLYFLRTRCRRFRVRMEWGRFGASAQFRRSRVRVAERWVDLARCDLPGRTVFDTFLAAQFYDLTERSLPSFGLKDLAAHFGLAGGGGDPGARTYLEGRAIGAAFRGDRERFRAYLKDDLRETAGIADILLPTYVAQAALFPMTLQEILLRGTGARVESVFLEKYEAAGRALPTPAAGESFVGGISRSFETGVFPRVLHFDVASLYPSLLLQIDRNPAGDDLGVLLPTLADLRRDRLEYKRLAREDPDPERRREFEARQASFKILINSFYGYLGFGGARFGDSGLAAEVTNRGRETLEQLIELFGLHGCRVLEADTDGLYVEAGRWWEEPQALLDAVNAELGENLDLELGGAYEAMLCYKAKNYALRQGEEVLVKGSALRSRGTEPFLARLTRRLIEWKLGVRGENPRDELPEWRTRLEEQAIPVEDLARGEYLSQSPAAYAKSVGQKGKSRRAALEVALRMDPPPKMGERVRFYITPGETKRTPEWQRARPLADYDPQQAPYDPAYYQKRLESWLDRYADLLEE